MITTSSANLPPISYLLPLKPTHSALVGGCWVPPWRPSHQAFMSTTPSTDHPSSLSHS